MNRYCIKCEPGRIEFMDILKETTGGFLVKVTREKDGYEKTVEEFMSRELFETCMNTGFIYKMEKASHSVA